MDSYTLTFLSKTCNKITSQFSSFIFFIYLSVIKLVTFPPWCPISVHKISDSYNSTAETNVCHDLRPINW
jgi:hypothetical protein